MRGQAGGGEDRGLACQDQMKATRRRAALQEKASTEHARHPAIELDPTWLTGPISAQTRGGAGENQGVDAPEGPSAT